MLQFMKGSILLGTLAVSVSMSLNFPFTAAAKSENSFSQTKPDIFKQGAQFFESELTKPAIAAASAPKITWMGSFDNSGRIFVSPDGRFVANLRGSTLSIYNLRSQQLFSRLEKVGLADTSAMHPRWKTIATAGINSQLRILDLETGQELQKLPIYRVRNEKTMIFSSRSDRVLFVAGDEGIQVVDVNLNKILGTIKYGRSQIKEIALDPIQNRFLVASYLWDGVAIWDLLGSGGRGYKTPTVVIPLPDEKSGASSMAISPDGSMLALGFSSETVRIYSVQSGKMLRELPPPSGKRGPRFDYSRVKGVRFSPNGKYLVAGYYILGLAVWDVRTGNLLQRAKVGQGIGVASETVEQIEFSPDGSLLVTDGDSKINIWKFQD